MSLKTDRANHHLLNNLKKHSGRKIIKSVTPKRLYDGCLELESYINSNIANFTMLKVNKQIMMNNHF